MVNSLELKKEKWDLVQRARAVIERAGQRELNTEEESEYSKLNSSIDELDKRIKRLEDLEQKEEDAPEQDDENDNDTEEERASRSRKRWPATSEGHDQRSVIGSPEYRKAFGTFLRTGQTRDLSVSGGDGAGNWITPVQLSKDFVTFLNAYTYVRDLAHVEEVDSAQSLGNPRLSSDLSDADWTDEVPGSDISSDTSMAGDRRDLTPNLLTKLVLVSIKELLLSTDVEKIVMDRLAYKHAVTLEKACFTGNGTGQGLGLFHASSNGISTARDVTASSTTGFNADDIYNMIGAVQAQYLKGDGVGIFAHRDWVTRARKLKDGIGAYIWQPSLSQGRPDTIAGINVYQSEFCPNTFTTGQYVACISNLKFYRMAFVKGGLSVQRLVERYAGTNQVGFIGRQFADMAPVREEASARMKLA